MTHSIPLAHGHETLTSFKDDICAGVAANLTKVHVLLLDDKKAIEPLLGEFRRIQLEWLKVLLTSTDDEVTKRSRPALEGDGVSKAPLYGLSVRFQDVEDGRKYRFSHLRSKSIPPEVWKSFEMDGWPAADRYCALLSETMAHDAQRRLIFEMLAKTQPLDALFIQPDYLYFPSFEARFEKAPDATSFLLGLIEEAEQTRAVREQPGRRVGKERYMPFFPSMMLFWLALNGVLLLPPRRSPFSEGPDGLRFGLMLLEARRPNFVSMLRKHYSDGSDKSRFSAETMPRRRELALCRMFSCTLMSGRTDAVPEMFAAVRDAAESTVEGNRNSDEYKHVFDAINRADGKPFRMTDLPQRGVEQRYLGKSLEWILLDRVKHPTAKYPKGVPEDYVSDECMQRWGIRFQRLLRRANSKSEGVRLRSYQIFLVWLSRNRPESSEMTAMTREAMVGPLDDGRQPFLDYLREQELSVSTNNEYLRFLSNAFEEIIYEETLRMVNPLRLDEDLVPSPPHRTNTERNAIPRRVVDLLLKINERDDHAFSRSIGTHHVEIRGGGVLPRKEWFPGFAVLIDLLLRIPLRGFQARFLDSGEEDALIYRLGEDGTPRMEANKLGRRAEGCLTTITGIDGVARAALYVNTNKKPLSEEDGYLIGWCPPELARKLLMLREWQSKNNPGQLIPCMERSSFRTHRNKNVTKAVKKSICLFRSPGSPGWPVSAGRLREYWDALVAEAEAEMTRRGTPMSLTVLDEKGRRKSAYDVHSLRVSGISNLISAGVPLEIVKKLSGHSGIAMVLYYDKVESSTLNDVMTKASEKMLADLTSDGPPIEQLALGNISDAHQKIALTMLAERRPRGDGSVVVMPHGVCPGGECATGGAEGKAVPPGACSICRYRLTGPAFLPGIVLNANRLMYELHEKAKEIEITDRKILDAINEGRATTRLDGQRVLQDTEAEHTARQWAAEVQYAEYAKRMLRSGNGENALISPDHEIETRLEEMHELALLQRLVEGASAIEGFRPEQALVNHRLLLADILSADSVSDLMLGIDRDLVDRAALLAGRTLCALIPEDRLTELATGSKKLSDFPAAFEQIQRLRDFAANGGLTNGDAPIALPAPRRMLNAVCVRNDSEGLA